MEQNTRLQAKLWKRERRSGHELGLVLTCRFFKAVCDMVWDMNLLRTSILVTKTPLTTLKCLSRKYIGLKHPIPALISDLKERTFRAIKETATDLFKGSKQFVYALIGRLD
jgi:hypothetical protein